MWRLRLILLLSGCLMVSCAGSKDAEPAQGNLPDDGPVSVEYVERLRSTLQWTCPDSYPELLKELNAEGVQRIYPAFEAILAEKDDWQIAVIFALVPNLKGDRRRFIEHAVHLLTHPDWGVRMSAVRFLGNMGSEAEASIVVALLSDEEGMVGSCAAEALEKIGGPREVIAIDVWLRGSSHRDDPDLRRDVKQSRDQLKKRLDRPGA